MLMTFPIPPKIFDRITSPSPKNEKLPPAPPINMTDMPANPIMQPESFFTVSLSERKTAADKSTDANVDIDVNSEELVPETLTMPI